MIKNHTSEYIVKQTWGRALKRLHTRVIVSSTEGSQWTQPQCLSVENVLLMSGDVLSLWLTFFAYMKTWVTILRMQSNHCQAVAPRGTDNAGEVGGQRSSRTPCPATWTSELQPEWKPPYKQNKTESNWEREPRKSTSGLHRFVASMQTCTHTHTQAWTHKNIFIYNRIIHSQTKKEITSLLQHGWASMTLL